MNKEIEQMMLTVPQKIVAYDSNPAGQHLYGEQRQEIAEALYNAGYRKPPEDSVVLSREEHEILVKTAQGKIGNMKATDFLKACISSGFMVEAVSTKEQVKQAVKEFAERLKEKAHKGAFRDPITYKFIERDYTITESELNELLKGYEK